MGKDRDERLDAARFADELLAAARAASEDAHHLDSERSGGLLAANPRRFEERHERLDDVVADGPSV